MLKPTSYTPLARKRVWLPKEDGTSRPLGMPSIQDRIVQAAYLEAINPLVEAQSCANSYGFRKYRGTKDAILSLRGNLIHPKASEWVYIADISKCFEKINHEFLLRHVPVHRSVDRNIIRLMLKAKVIDQSLHIEPEEGTPQGSVLSPILMNVALNGLKAAIFSPQHY